MKKRKTFTSMAIVIAILILGVGYAAIAEIPLTLNGSANVHANADFNVQYDTNHEVKVTPNANVTWEEKSNPAVVTGSYEDTLNANMTVYLDSANRTASAIYKIDNKSGELKATIASEITNDFTEDNANYLSLEQALYTTEACTDTDLLNTTQLAPGQSAYLKVTVSLVKLPVDDIVDASFSVGLTATPVEVELSND